ncbi:MAG: lysylphosphatidylglycerol synthase transmembrane domain-containing protein [Bryobacteraceae bacterium]
MSVSFWSSAGDGKQRARRTAILVTTNLISLVCLWWVLHDLNLSGLKAEIKDLDWRWIAVAAVSDVVVYFWQGWRWSLLLNPITAVPVWQSTRAIFVGLFANELLPLRSGEVIRCYLQSLWSKIPLSVSLASALIERIFDGIWLVLCLLLTYRRVGLPRDMLYFTAVVGLLVTGMALLVGFAMFHKQHAHAALSGSKWHKHVRVLIDDLHLIGRSRSLYFSFLVSLPFLLFQIVPIYALTQAYGFDISVGGAAVIVVILRLSAAVPQAPGNMGGFQAATILTLRMLGIEGPIAKRFSLVSWVVITLPLLIAGFVALIITGARLADLHREAQLKIEAKAQG